MVVAMNDMRREIELKLCANLLRDWCHELAQADAQVEFEDGWCSSARTIRFCTAAADGILEGLRGKGDCWGLGRFVFYEIAIAPEALALSLTASLQGLGREARARIVRLADALGVVCEGDRVELASWMLLEGAYSGNEALQAVEDCWCSDVAFFEKALSEWSAGGAPAAWRIPETSRELVVPGDLAGELFIEGAEVTILTDRFERSRAARRRCIAAHGTACAVCGVDFGRLYGPQFAGKIEVHHRKPLNEIREDYVVNPVTDLVPVCPNCHMVIHSKPGGGAYSVEEVRNMLRQEPID